MTTNNALQSVIDTLNSIPNPPDLEIPNVFDLLSNFWSGNLGIINGLRLEPFISLLQPVYDFLTERRCVWFFGERCFRITDIFDNWLVELVQGLIDSFLTSLLAPIQDMFRDILGGLMLPGLPSLSISQPDWGYINIQFRPGFEFLRFFDRFQLRCPSFRCLTMVAMRMLSFRTASTSPASLSRLRLSLVRSRLIAMKPATRRVTRRATRRATGRAIHCATPGATPGATQVAPPVATGRATPAVTIAVTIVVIFFARSERIY